MDAETQPPKPVDNELPSDYADRLGQFYATTVKSEYKKKFGQFFTPLEIARFMGKMVDYSKKM